MNAFYSFGLEDDRQRAHLAFEAGDDYEGVLLTDPGGREENQDAFAAAQASDGGWVFCVADGLGGHSGGRIAAATAVRAVADAALEAGFDSASAQSLDVVFARADAAISQAAADDPALRSMRSTLAVLLLRDDAALWGHVGDSRVYLLRNEAIVTRTRDHSVPQMLVDMGEIAPADIPRHPDRNRLLKVLGGPDTLTRPTISPESRPLAPGDTLLLATDGFWERLTDDALIRLSCLNGVRKTLSGAENEIRANASSAAADAFDNYSALILRREDKINSMV